MKTKILFAILLCAPFLLHAQNVGVGTNDPQDLIHIKDGHLRLEGNDRYINFFADNPGRSGLRFYSDDELKSALYYSPIQGQINLAKNFGGNGLVYYPATNKLLLGRDFSIGSEVFGIRANTDGFGGMYIETDDVNGKPFYGYATNGTSRAWTYYDGGTSTWRLNNNGDKLTLTSDGKMGLLTSAPIAKFHIEGNDWNLAGSDGSFAIGTSTNRLAFGMATDGLGAGTGRIYAKGATNRIILGGGTNDVVSILGDTKRVGIGTNDPLYQLDIQSDQTRGINLLNSYDGTSIKYGGRFESSSDGSGTRYGVYAVAYGNNTLSGTTYAGRFLANGSSSTGSVYGIYSQVSAPGTGNHYGIYTVANTTNPGTNTKSWALYASGNSYFSNDVRIGNLDGAAGYKLSVDGKIMGEELKVQLSQNWPDYVFAEDYELRSTEELELYIRKNKHLPGVPSAQEISADGGFYVGEMNRILLEKVEELTLLLILQNKKINQLAAKINSK